jgi:hypothetical protein
MEMEMEREVEPVRCTACAVRGRISWLTDPISRELKMGPTCARRVLAAHPGRVAAAVQLALDLGDVAQAPVRDRRRAAA